MTDLEMVALCAEAMGLVEHARTPEAHGFYTTGDSFACWRYDPLHDDAQAMALVKAENLDVVWGPGELRWTAGQFCFKSEHGMEADGLYCATKNADLNRAIVGCVAKMQSDTSGGKDG